MIPYLNIFIAYGLSSLFALEQRESQNGLTTNLGYFLPASTATSSSATVSSRLAVSL